MGGMEMEELYAIISELTKKYTGGDSTSVPYEAAEQLAGARERILDASSCRPVR